MEAFRFFSDIWVESSPNRSFLLRPLKYFLMEGGRPGGGPEKNPNARVENRDLTRCKLSRGLDAVFPIFPIKRKAESWNISDAGGFWFAKKNLGLEEK